ncbi:hypothetical protein BDW16_1524 [Sphingomonas koreensis]|nr:hypothetical protein BDW16_1524 [Sphingomonas koreensis]
MHEPYADRFWAENHHILSNGIDRGFGRIGRTLRRLLGRVVPPDASDEARKRTYCIG